MSGSAERESSYEPYLRTRHARAVRGPWLVFGETQREDGWKLHVSTTPSQAPALLARLQSILAGVECFKFARTELTLGQLNEGALGATQVGKFLTIYPRSDDECLDLASRIVAATTAFEGPVIVTDVRLGAVVFARFGPFRPRPARNRLGLVTLTAEAGDGSTRIHRYSAPHETPEGVRNLFAGWSGAPPLPEPSGAVFGPGYLIVDTLKPSPRGSVFLAIDIRDRANPDPCVLKEGRQHCNSDRSGRDIRSRLRLQQTHHAALAGRVRVPEVSEYFEVSGNGYLAMKFIEGADLEQICSAPLGGLPAADQCRILRVAIDIIDQVAGLHAAGLVHRDLSPSNILVDKDDAAWLIDLELAHALTSTDPPFTQGTAGFISPQQLSGNAPSIDDDLYGVAAVLTFLFTRIDPRRYLTHASNPSAAELGRLSLAPRPLAVALARALSLDPADRGSLEDLRQSLQAALDGAPIRACRSPLVRGDARKHRVALAANGLVDGCLRDETTGLWLSAIANPLPGSVSQYQHHRSANRGVAGVIYALARAARLLDIPQSTQDLIARSVDWLLTHAPTSDDQLPGLHFGEAGVAVAIAECLGAGLLPDGPWTQDYFDEALSGPLDWPDVSHGAAGQGLAAHQCDQILPGRDLQRHAARCAAYLMATQEADGAWSMPPGVEGMSGDRLTGFAHGVSGMVYFLAEHASRGGDPRARGCAERGAEWLMRNAVKRGGIRYWPTREGGKDVWQWWCHGAPGIALMWLRLAELWQESELARIAASALQGHPRDVRHSNLSQCHGMAGLADIDLRAGAALGARTIMDRGLTSVETLWNLRRPTPAGVTWLVEDPSFPTADLMVGAGGCLHALVSAAAPEDCRPPLLPAAQ